MGLFDSETSDRLLGDCSETDVKEEVNLAVSTNTFMGDLDPEVFWEKITPQSSDRTVTRIMYISDIHLEHHLNKKYPDGVTLELVEKYINELITILAREF